MSQGGVGLASTSGGRNEVLSWRGWLSGWEGGRDSRRLSLGGGQVLFWKEGNEARGDPTECVFCESAARSPAERDGRRA